MIRQQRIKNTIYILAFVLLVLLMMLLAAQVDDIAAAVMQQADTHVDERVNWCYSACTFIR
ncbi:MAG: hypothetical protein CUN56_12790 [Phototrophicales bacterium]|nr:MAG: hypothetical protein CUN56_12790 [Phototrophicales bacterium]